MHLCGASICQGGVGDALEGAISCHGVRDGDSMVGKCDDDLLLAFALAPLVAVVGATDWVCANHGESRQG